MMPQYNDPNWRNHPNVTRFSRIQVARAMHEAIRILEHDVGESTGDFFENRISACEMWLSDPIGTTEQTRAEINSLLEILQSARPIATHPNVLSIKQLAEASRRMADWVGELMDWDGWEEYGDVFDLLTEILRCPKCYGGMYYNRIDQNTGRQFDWGTIARALIEDKSLVLPDGYTGQQSIVGPLPNADDSVELARSVRSVSLLLQIDYDAVAWQIIKHSVHMETANGPRWALRYGRWRKLAEHTHRMSRLLEPLTSRTCPYVDAEMRSTAIPLLAAVTCTARKWFDDFLAEQKIIPSNEALELSRRLAETGEPRSDTSKRCVPLFDMDLVTRELLESNMLIDETEDWTVDPHRGSTTQTDDDDDLMTEMDEVGIGPNTSLASDYGDIDVGLESSDGDDETETTREAIRGSPMDADIVDLGPPPANGRRLFNTGSIPPPDRSAPFGRRPPQRASY